MMKLIKTQHYSGYLAEDIKKELTPKRYEEFSKWFTGQTGAIHKGKLLIYKWDFDNFMSGRNPIPFD